MSQRSNLLTEPIYVDAKVFPFAGFWIRMIAYLFDAFMITLVNSTFLSLIMLLQTEESQFNHSKSVIIKTIGIIIFLAYFCLFTKYNKGQTLGKMLTGIRVVNKKFTTDLSWIQIFYREIIARYIQKVILPFYLIVAVTTNKQHIGDLLGDTYVIKDEYFNFDDE